MHISEQEVWLRAYCAALTGGMSTEHSAEVISVWAKERANQAVKDFLSNFPKFQFVCNESKGNG